MNQKIILIVILLIMGTLSENSDDWPMFMHDPQHTGYSPSGMSHDLREAWRYENTVDSHRFDPGEKGLYTQFAVLKGKIFAVQFPSLLFCLDMEGSLLWSIQLKGVLTGFPAAADDRLCVGATDEILYLSSSTGDVLWKYETEFINFSSSPIIVDNHIYVGSGQPYHPNVPSPEARDALNHARRVLCLDTDGGKVVWEFYCRGFVDSSPAYLDGRIFVNDGSTIYCLDAETGTLIWEKKVGTLYSSVSLDRNRLFVGSSGGTLHCLDIETGESLWETDCGGSFCATPATAYNRVFIGSEDGVFYCLDAEGGDIVWKVETGSRVYSSLVVADGKVAFGTEDGRVYMVNVGSGTVLGSLDLEGSGITALALSDGTLITGEENGRITCFEGTRKNIGIPATFLIATCAVVVAGMWYRRTVKTRAIERSRE